VKPAALSYARPATLAEALSLLEEYGDDAKVLAGGQSLVPMMNFRLARPEILVDIGGIAELSHVTVTDEMLCIGATTTQRAVQTSAEACSAYPALAQAMRHIGHVQTRNRGTFGGSIAHADPSAEIPAVLLAARGSLRLTSAARERWVDASDFFLGPYQTALGPTEILTEVRFPVSARDVSGFVELAPRLGDFATCGVAAVLRFGPDSDKVERASLAAIGVDSRPVRLARVESVLTGRALSDEVVRLAAMAGKEDVEPMPDLHSDAAYRRHLLVVLLSRLLGGLSHAAGE
jgi:CO/xanthine dehydrogenase FAD-binding subunit